MALSSNEMFELADNNYRYLEACKVQSLIGLWQPLETFEAGL
jgi:hypothetical protein